MEVGLQLVGALLLMALLIYAGGWIIDAVGDALGDEPKSRDRNLKD